MRYSVGFQLARRSPPSSMRARRMDILVELDAGNYFDD